MKIAETSVEIHPLIAERWSPRSFDETVQLDDVAAIAMLEAARWAPSANNSQPWRFAIVKREEALFNEIHEALAGFNKEWAPRAAAFVVVGAETSDVDGKERKWAEYDTGLAVSLLTTQAHAMGWHVHQMGGFKADVVAEKVGFNDRTRLLAVIAVGKLAAADQLSDELARRETAGRSRVPLEELVVHGLPTL
jgi:nitroreductase